MIKQGLFSAVVFCITASFGAAAKTTACTVSDASAITATCKCATAATTDECAIKKFCWADNTCNLAAKTTNFCDTSFSGIEDEATNHFTANCSDIRESGQTCNLTVEAGYRGGSVTCNLTEFVIVVAVARKNNVRTKWMIANNKYCGMWRHGLKKHCNKKAKWRKNKFCNDACCAAGSGYGDCRTLQMMKKGWTCDDSHFQPSKGKKCNRNLQWVKGKICADECCEAGFGYEDCERKDFKVQAACAKTSEAECNKVIIGGESACKWRQVDNPSKNENSRHVFYACKPTSSVLLWGHGY